MDLFQSFVEKICLCVSVTYLFTVSSEKRAMSLVAIFFPLSLICLFVALRPKSTDMVIAGWSVHLATSFSWASFNKQLTSTSCTYFLLLHVTDNNPF